MTRTTSKIARFRVRDTYLEIKFTPVERKVTQIKGKIDYSRERERTTENDQKQLIKQSK